MAGGAEGQQDTDDNVRHDDIEEDLSDPTLPIEPEGYPPLAAPANCAKNWDVALLQHCSLARLRQIARKYDGIPQRLNKPLLHSHGEPSSRLGSRSRWPLHEAEPLLIHEQPSALGFQSSSGSNFRGSQLWCTATSYNKHNREFPGSLPPPSFRISRHTCRNLPQSRCLRHCTTSSPTSRSRPIHP